MIECPKCGFEYREHKDHIIQCPVCECADLQQRLSVALAVSVTVQEECANKCDERAIARDFWGLHSEALWARSDAEAIRRIKFDIDDAATSIRAKVLDAQTSAEIAIRPDQISNIKTVTVTNADGPLSWAKPTEDERTAVAKCAAEVGVPIDGPVEELKRQITELQRQLAEERIKLQDAYCNIQRQKKALAEERAAREALTFRLEERAQYLTRLEERAAREALGSRKEKS